MAKLTEEDKKILKIREDAVKAWQPYITWLTSSERRQMRRRRVWDAAKWWLSAVYNVATWLPHLASKFVTAPIDAVAWTNVTWKIDDIVWYVPSKLRDSTSDPKLFDNTEKVATIATAVGGMMAWWGLWKSTWKVNTTAANKNVFVKNYKSSPFTRTKIWTLPENSPLYNKAVQSIDEIIAQRNWFKNAQQQTAMKKWLWKDLESNPFVNRTTVENEQLARSLWWKNFDDMDWHTRWFNNPYISKRTYENLMQLEQADIADDLWNQYMNW